MKNKINDLLRKNDIWDVQLTGVVPNYKDNKIKVTYVVDDYEGEVNAKFPDHFNDDQIAYLVFIKICENEDISYDELTWNEDIEEVSNYLAERGDE